MKSEVMKRKNLWQTYSEVQLEKLEKPMRYIVYVWMKEKQNGSVYRKPSNLPELRDTKI